jgi:hypothetical protein
MLISLLIILFIGILLMQLFSPTYKEGFGEDDDDDTPTLGATTLGATTLGATTLGATTLGPVTLAPVTTESTESTESTTPSMAPVTGQMDPSIPSRVAVLEQKVSKLSANVDALSTTSNDKYIAMNNNISTAPPT